MCLFLCWITILQYFFSLGKQTILVCTPLKYHTPLVGPNPLVCPALVTLYNVLVGSVLDNANSRMDHSYELTIFWSLHLFVLVFVNQY
jgi:hypothetical protein